MKTELNQKIMDRVQEIILEERKKQPDGYTVCQNGKIHSDDSGTWFVGLVLQNNNTLVCRDYGWVIL